VTDAQLSESELVSRRIFRAPRAEVLNQCCAFDPSKTFFRNLLGLLSTAYWSTKHLQFGIRAARTLHSTRSRSTYPEVSEGEIAAWHIGFGGCERRDQKVGHLVATCAKGQGDWRAVPSDTV
jgi:hypothetical protein